MAKTPNGVSKVVATTLIKHKYSNATSQEGLLQLLKLFDAIVVPIFCLVSCLSPPNREAWERSEIQRKQRDFAMHGPLPLSYVRTYEKIYVDSKKIYSFSHFLVIQLYI